MSRDKKQDKDDSDGSKYESSETKNVFGVGLEKASPYGKLGALITVPLTLFFGVLGFSKSFGFLILAWLAFMGAFFSIIYGMSEKRWHRISGVDRDTDLDYNERHGNMQGGTKSICRECHQEISSSVNRCPHCGWKPEKKGGLWWATTAVMSMNPIGLAMGAKGASDKIKASRGVTKEIQAQKSDDAQEPEQSQEEVKVSSEADPSDAIERLNELQEQGAITEAEFEEKKKELLDRI